jgi:translation initiation factor IF-2
MEAALAGMLEPEIVETVQGRAEVRQIFSVGKSQQVAGSYVTDGRIVRGGARVYRNGEVIATDRVVSVRRFKDDVREVTAGFECGIALAGFHAFEEFDVIESFTTETIARAVTR